MFTGCEKPVLPLLQLQAGEQEGAHTGSFQDPNSLGSSRRGPPGPGPLQSPASQRRCWEPGRQVVPGSWGQVTTKGSASFLQAGTRHTHAMTGHPWLPSLDGGSRLTSPGHCPVNTQPCGRGGASSCAGGHRVSLCVGRGVCGCECGWGGVPTHAHVGSRVLSMHTRLRLFFLLRFSQLENPSSDFKLENQQTKVHTLALPLTLLSDPGQASRPVRASVSSSVK